MLCNDERSVAPARCLLRTGFSTMLVVCTLADHDVSRARVIESASAVGLTIEVQECREVLPALRRTVVTALVTGMEDLRRESVLPSIALVHSEFPSLAIVTVYNPSRLSAANLVPLARSPIDAVVAVESTARAPLLHDALRCAIQRRNVDAALTRVLPCVPSSLHAFITYCFANAHAAPTVAQAARTLGLDRSTIASRLACAHLPPARDVIGLARLHNAARLLATESWTVGQIGVACEFGGGAGLSKFVHRHLKMWPTELKRVGGADYVLDQVMLRLSPGSYPKRQFPTPSRNGVAISGIATVSETPRSA